MGIFTLIGACLMILLLQFLLYCGLGYLLAPFYKKLDKKINDALIEFLEQSSILCKRCDSIDTMQRIIEVDIEEILEDTIKKEK